MGLYDFVRPLLFSVDPETIHEAALKALATGVFQARPFADERLRVDAFGQKFSNPLGLAAGFDKNGVGLNAWPGFGFGFAEIGTVTALPQPGNPKPRLHRFPKDQALINRLGFNNEGAEAVADRLRQIGKASVPVGINLGKSKVTPLERAPEDYARSYALLEPFGDYFVVNVSSPNTPGLRGLQEKSALADILAALGKRKPLFVKVAPDLEESALDDILAVAHDAQLTGLIATNTTLARDGLSGSGPFPAGGLSGGPVFEKSTAVLRFLAKNADPKLILIGVGGILTADNLYVKLAAGADLCQLYTGWVYGGPDTVPNLLEGLLVRMEQVGVRNLSELRASVRG